MISVNTSPTQYFYFQALAQMASECIMYRTHQDRNLFGPYIVLHVQESGLVIHPQNML